MALIVTGVHRSGTSMIAGILSNLSIPMGEGAVMNPAPENPEGFFERIDVMQLNDSVLKKLGGSWQAPPNLGPESLFSIDQNVLSHYRSSIDLFSGSFNSWFVKDPRISLILPIWDRLALTNLSLIFSVRNPQSVAQSLHLRNGLSHRRAIALWWAYNQQLLSSVDSRDTLFIDYDSAKRSKKVTTEKIASFALKAVKVSPNITFDSSVGNYEEDRILNSLKIKKAEQSINSKLSRSSSTKLMKGLAKSEIDETMDLYMVLKNLHGSTNTKFKKLRTPDWVYEELQSARVEFQLNQTIEKLYDHLETSKIEIATLNQLAPSTSQTQELELAQSTLHTQSEELDRLRTNVTALEADRDRLQTYVTTLEEQRDSAQTQALLLHNESERERKELKLAQSTLHTQSQELDRLQTFRITLEAERDSAQTQALLLHNEIERERKEFELAQSTLHTLSEELDRLRTNVTALEADRNCIQSFVITLEEQRDSAQSQVLLMSAKARKSAEALSAISGDLTDKITELNNAVAELDKSKNVLVSLQGDIAEEKLFSQRLEHEFRNQIRQVVIFNNKNLELELDSIKSSKSYRMISKFWKIRAKWHRVL